MICPRPQVTNSNHVASIAEEKDACQVLFTNSTLKFSILLACLLVLYIIITIGILDQEICAQKWFSTIFYVATHFEQMGVVGFRTFIFVGRLMFNFSRVLLSLMIITRWVGE
jgi:hypothetical protein